MCARKCPKTPRKTPSSPNCPTTSRPASAISAGRSRCRCRPRVIPLMRADRDLIVQARTGSGKTGAFGIPIVADDRPRARRAAGAGARADARARRSRSRPRSRRSASTAGVRTPADLRRRRLRPADRRARARARTSSSARRAASSITSATAGSSSTTSAFFVLDEADELLSLGFWPDMQEIEQLPAAEGAAPDLPLLGDDARRRCARCRASSCAIPSS